MYTPTHIVVTVHRARGLLTKGKNGSNNCFTTIALGKEKYQTSIKDNSPTSVEWHEECELAIPTQGNRAELTLTCLHHNGFGLDEFLGQVTLPLIEMDQFERPRPRWFKLQSKPGHDKKDKDRGELEIRVSFTVKAGSLSDLNKKDGKKVSSSGGVGGSLLSLGSIEKRKSLAKFAKSLGSKMHVTGKKKKKDKSDDSDSFSGSFSSLGTPNLSLKNSSRSSGIGISNADPGVISEDEDEFVFDNLSHKSSANSLSRSKTKVNNLILTDEIANASPEVSKKQLETPQKVDEWETKLYGKSVDHSPNTDSLKRRSLEKTRIPLNSEKKEQIDDSMMDRISLSDRSPTNPFEVQVDAGNPFENMSTVNEDSHDNENNISSISSASPKDKSDNIFSKKWRNFKRDITPLKQDVQMKNHYNKSQLKESEPIKQITEESEEKIRKFTYEKKEKKEELPIEILSKYEGKSKEEIMKIAHNLENDLIIQKRQNRELEEYLDLLLLRVMETHPKILQNPYNGKNHVKQSG